MWSRLRLQVVISVLAIAVGAALVTTTTPASADGSSGAFVDDDGHLHEWAIEFLHQQGHYCLLKLKIVFWVTNMN